MIRFFATLSSIILIAIPALGFESAPVTSKRAIATLITDRDTVHAGGQARVALRLRLADGWHTYWRNPGEAGVAVELATSLSPGATQGPIEWPAPERIVEGAITTYGFSGEIVLPFMVTLAPDVSAVRGQITARYLVCKDICVPEEAAFSFDLPEGDLPEGDLPKGDLPKGDLPEGTGTRSAQGGLFDAHDEAVPRPSPWPTTIAPDGTLSVIGQGLSAASIADARFFPDRPDEIIDDAAQVFSARDGGFTLGLRLSRGFVPESGLRGVLSIWDRGGSRVNIALSAVPPGRQAPGESSVGSGTLGSGSATDGLAAPGLAAPGLAAPGLAAPGLAAPGLAASGSAASGSAASGSAASGSAAIGLAGKGSATGGPITSGSAVSGPALTGPAFSSPATTSVVPIGQALLYALLGGLVLNLMPCVFPILAMKAVGFASGVARGRARAHAVAYTGGVLATFLGVAVALLVARSAGMAAGWGFQFASPVFVTAMAWLSFAVGLNLSGIYQIGGGFAGAGGGLAAREGHWGSFFTGALAVLVATPCTAPFMAVAIASGLAAPPWFTLLVFLTMGLGLASPYLILSTVPALTRIIPQPGRWMDLLRQFLAFPMYGAAVWLLWVVGQEAGPSGILGTASGFVLLAFAAWSFGVTRDMVGRVRLLGGAGACLALSLAMLVLFRIETMPGSPPGESGSEAFTPARLATLRAEGRPVFVNLTAAWCVTCLVNERVAISNDTVRRAFASRNVAYLKGDWTRQDPAITEFLRQQGRDGVPLYLYYAPRAGSPKVLPQLLTESTVLNAVGAS